MEWVWEGIKQKIKWWFEISSPGDLVSGLFMMAVGFIIIIAMLCVVVALNYCLFHWMFTGKC